MQLSRVAPTCSPTLCYSTKRCLKMERTESSSKSSPFYRSASRLLCSCRLPITPWLEAREGHIRTDDNSHVPRLAHTDLQYGTTTPRILTISSLIVKELTEVQERAEKWESKQPLHCIMVHPRPVPDCHHHHTS
jgi:hypothetical protein